ncbi:hypothetical protein SDRG_03293 [Saprolegnia diclina VS20]|uniref:MORN repeat-containing protein 5 n=1 Tax=Saprolegnia diclina (strain VS20) TaxID=1156394 RepID=T0QYF3_SAPDV|nr:hypothetical protein SDRG_03293 [Saprolegnia diclina VS20]EQC39085.1 hypothetical protein SDRG_03293 [Saprolegnia diclina VS20]|eukprot:XP_008607146.1 hypothetical protein SDRG_03293 [Saprolegnia diclina VS20]
MEYTQSSYEGNTSFGRLNGHGVYTFPDGSRYEGDFQNGQFHGRGTLFFPQGRYDGTWKDGKKVDGKFTFADGLEYATPWNYSTEDDRRYHCEKVAHATAPHANGYGIKPPGETAYCTEGVQKMLPYGYYDAGNGFYDEFTNTVVPASTLDPGDAREATEDEAEWIKAKAAKGFAK